MKKRIHQIELFLKYPNEVQAEWLQKLVCGAKDTEWGKKYGYSSIVNWETYKERVPIQTYESLSPFIDRVRQGEQNILWQSPIRFIAKSSGTTSNKSKYIPVSQEALDECHFKGGKDLLSIYCNNYPDTQIFSGKSLGLGGSEQVCDFKTDAFHGDVSAIIMQNLPFWAELIRVPDLSIALMKEWEKKIDEITRTTIKQNITSIAGVPSWILVLLRYMLETTGKSDVHEIWPNLELYIHGGVSFEPYRSQFKQIMPSSNMNYVETYNASEGFFGIQDRKEADDMLLMLDYGIFYEFIPYKQNELDYFKVLKLDEVSVGENYAMVISTNAGLWRYLIGDTVQFTSVNPYRIKITGRTKSFINAFGEELIVENAEKALLEACKMTNARIKEYTAAPIYFSDSKSGAHQWLIEFELMPSDIISFEEVLDNTLKSLNSDYEAKRYKDMTLGKPLITIAPENTFHQWLRKKGKLGGQHKVPRLSNNRHLIEELLEMISFK